MFAFFSPYVNGAAPGTAPPVRFEGRNLVSGAVQPRGASLFYLGEQLDELLLPLCLG